MLLFANYSAYILSMETNIVAQTADRPAKAASKKKINYMRIAAWDDQAEKNYKRLFKYLQKLEWFPDADNAARANWCKMARILCKHGMTTALVPDEIADEEGISYGLFSAKDEQDAKDQIMDIFSRYFPKDYHRFSKCASGEDSFAQICLSKKISYGKTAPNMWLIVCPWQATK